MKQPNIDASAETGAELRIIVKRYQEVYARWEDATEPAVKAEFRQQLGAVQEQLWAEIEYPLRQVAKGWLHSWAVEDMGTHTTKAADGVSSLDALAMSLYFIILKELPGLKVLPAKNLYGCIKEIARHRLIDQQRKVARQRAQREPLDDPPATSAGSRWISGIRDSATYYENEEQGLVDQTSYDATDRLIERLDRQDISAMVYAYWERTLPNDDYCIMRRWMYDPPTAFRTLAEQLGSGWTEGAVRQRHFRILNRTKQFLKDQGLLDDE